MTESIEKGESAPQNLQERFKGFVFSIVQQYFSNMDGEVYTENGKAICLFDVFDKEGRTFKIKVFMRLSQEF